tara:strand:+ start:6391 stop:6720 length:330 start_codon:yes stop_codon:yes gene_type:complete
MIILSVGDKVCHERFDMAGIKLGTIVNIEHESARHEFVFVDGEFRWDREPITYKKKPAKTVFPLSDIELAGVFYTIKYDDADEGEDFGYETLFEDSGYLELINKENEDG